MGDVYHQCGFTDAKFRPGYLNVAILKTPQSVHARTTTYLYHIMDNVASNAISIECERLNSKSNEIFQHDVLPISESPEQASSALLSLISAEMLIRSIV